MSFSPGNGILWNDQYRLGEDIDIIDTATLFFALFYMVVLHGVITIKLNDCLDYGGLMVHRPSNTSFRLYILHALIWGVHIDFRLFKRALLALPLYSW